MVRDVWVYRIVVSAFAAVLLIAAVGALLLPLSGPTAGVGRAMLDAAHMALADIADDGIELLPRDTGGTAAGAARAAQETLAQGVVMVLGPLLQAEVEAVKYVSPL